MKTLKIRCTRCTKLAGERNFLVLSGTGGLVLGSVQFVECHGPLGRSEWAELAAEHCVSGAALPYPNTYAWEFTAPVCFRCPVPYQQKAGTVIWVLA